MSTADGVEAELMALRAALTPQAADPDLAQAADEDSPEFRVRRHKGLS